MAGSAVLKTHRGINRPALRPSESRWRQWHHRSPRCADGRRLRASLRGSDPRLGRTRHQALAASAEDFKRSAILARERYEQGYASYLNVLEAQRSLYAAQDALALSDQQLSDNLIAIYKALGGGWQTDQLAIARADKSDWR